MFMETNDRNKFSAAMIRDTALQAWLRFPVAVAWLALFAIGMLLALIRPEFLENCKNLGQSLMYGGGMGYFATTAVTLWCEFLGKPKNAAIIVASVLVAIDSVILYYAPAPLGDAAVVRRAALGTALVIACFFVPADRGNAWHFAWSQFCNLAAAVLVGLACIFATMMIYGTVRALFEVDCENFISYGVTLGGLTLPALMILGRTVTQVQNNEDAVDFRLTSFGSGFFLYFLLPITVVYMAVLYVYGLDILFRWSLPKGVVTGVGTGLCAAVLVLLFFLEGVRRSNPTNTTVPKVLKWLPWLTLPVVLLMSVAIGYRISQYGFTAPRLYVLTFNIWCWAVFILLGLKENRNYGRVAQSFAIVFVATSILPWANFMTLGEYLEGPQEDKTEVDVVSDYKHFIDKDDIAIPEGFTCMREVSVAGSGIDNGIAKVGGVGYSFPADSLMAVDERDFSTFFIRPVSETTDSIVAVNSVRMEKMNDGVRIYGLDGYIFTK